MHFAVGVFPVAIEILQCLLAVGGQVQRQFQPRLSHSAPKKEYVVFVVLNEEYDFALLYHDTISADGSSIQNLLPRPLDSRPTFPPILSTDFLTMARPIPVPS